MNPDQCPHPARARIVRYEGNNALHHCGRCDHTIGFTDPWIGVSETEAQLQPCSLCKATPGHSCVYVSNGSWYAADDRIGQPCQRSHAERRNKAWGARRRLARQSAPAVPVGRLIRAAEIDWIRREWLQMRQWLTQHGDLLWQSEEDQ